jgi:hypothetical protein
MRQYGRGDRTAASAPVKAAIFTLAVVVAVGIAALIGYVIFGANLSRNWLPAREQAQQPRPVDSELATILLRNTVVAVHQANITGNYTVLRDLAAPAFQDKNSTADLALAFAPLRQQKLDLAPVVLLEPTFTQKPVIDRQNMLRLAGTLQSKPVPVAYELAFQKANGSWRWSAISIKSMPQAAAAPPTPPPAPPPAPVEDR